MEFSVRRFILIYVHNFSMKASYLYFLKDKSIITIVLLDILTKMYINRNFYLLRLNVFLHMISIPSFLHMMHCSLVNVIHKMCILRIGLK